MRLQSPARGALLLAAVCVTWLGCPVTPPPGDVAMGQYAITASEGRRGVLLDGGEPFYAVLDAGPPLLEDGGVSDAGVDAGPQCGLVEITDREFEFSAVLTRDLASQAAWVTLNGYSREGTFDGQVLTSTAEANRVFEACSKCTTRVVETISLAVLSRSQNEASGGVCPENPLDGGVVLRPDAGIVAPGLTLQGYDAVRVCGELVTEVVAVDGECDPACSGCISRFQLRGDRR